MAIMNLRQAFILAVFSLTLTNLVKSETTQTNSISTTDQVSYLELNPSSSNSNLIFSTYFPDVIGQFQGFQHSFLRNSLCSFSHSKIR